MGVVDSHGYSPVEEIKADEDYADVDPKFTFATEESCNTEIKDEGSEEKIDDIDVS